MAFGMCGTKKPDKELSRNQLCLLLSPVENLVKTAWFAYNSSLNLPIQFFALALGNDGNGENDDKKTQVYGFCVRI